MIYIVDNILSLIFSNKYYSTLVSMFLVFYGSNAAPNLLEIKDLFNNRAFKIFILSLIVYKSGTLNKFNSKVKSIYSILIAIAFSLIFEFCSSKYLNKEGFVEEKPEFPQCSNLPEPGRVVQNLVENEDGTCKFEYEITRFPVGLCTGTFDGVKFCTNSPREDVEIIGCSKVDTLSDSCYYYYNHDIKTQTE